MNVNFQTVIQASDAERRGLFLTTATRLGTAVQHVEKDFWVCWVLDALFNGLPPEGPRLLFKGGTSLSKSFGLISRFSEDIDITVFRQDIGEPIEVSDLHALSGKQRRVRLSRIRSACQQYIAEVMAVNLAERTFWDKIIILHGVRQWHDRRGELRQGGQRVSRHFYDVYRLLQHPDINTWLANQDLAQDCALHARLFFGSGDLGLELAECGSFTLTPSQPLSESLERDYVAMGGMVFGVLPEIRDVVQSIEALEHRLNARGR